MVRGFSDLRADGDQCLKYLTWEAKGKRHRVEADVLLVHEGIVPRIHETLALNCDHHWNEEQGYLAAKLDRWGETSREGLFVAGDAGGIGGWLAATISGEIAALGIASRLGISSETENLRRASKLDQRRKEPSHCVRSSMLCTRLHGTGSTTMSSYVDAKKSLRGPSELPPVTAPPIRAQSKLLRAAEWGPVRVANAAIRSRHYWPRFMISRSRT